MPPKTIKEHHLFNETAQVDYHTMSSQSDKPTCPTDVDNEVNGGGDCAKLQAEYSIDKTEIKMMSVVKVFSTPHPPVEPVEQTKEDTTSDMYTQCV